MAGLALWVRPLHEVRYEIGLMFSTGYTAVFKLLRYF